MTTKDGQITGRVRESADGLRGRSPQSGTEELKKAAEAKKLGNQEREEEDGRSKP